MAKGQQKPSRDKKKPKQDKGASKPKSAYQQSMAGSAAAQPLTKKK
jgi:hypothetical protein